MALAQSRDFPDWMAEYGPALRAYFRKKAGAAEAEDLVQEVFVAMQARGVEGIDHVGRYVFRVAANVMAARNRPGTWRWSEHAMLDELILADECSPERALIAKEALEDLLAGLKSAPPRAAQAFILHRFEQLSYEEIARRMGISVKAVEMNVRRTMERVMARMEAQS
ncbi:MAG TPA: RNA polymerase sigma factor [Caulobacteraceae bacterium]